MHLPSAQHLLLPDHRDVVFGLAADDARVAADAGIDVDRHAPLVAFVREFGVQRDRPRRRLIVFMHHLRIADVLVTCHGAHDVPAFHQVVILRAGELILLACPHDLDAGAKPRRV